MENALRQSEEQRRLTISGNSCRMPDVNYENLLAVVKTMKLSEISAETLEKIKSVRWDRIIEKHEDPESWESVFRYEEP
ncbi:hypothetical protein [Nostoc flagelliforme]|uniref:hypothetical protein n=1 Tax=Nostoc flagelliforme TaxID=1306274 RepID=UPI0026B69E66